MLFRTLFISPLMYGSPMFQIGNTCLFFIDLNFVLWGKQADQCPLQRRGILEYKNLFIFGQGPLVHHFLTLLDSLSNQKLSTISLGFLYFLIRSALNPNPTAPAEYPAKINSPADLNSESSCLRTSSIILRPWNYTFLSSIWWECDPWCRSLVQ